LLRWLWERINVYCEIVSIAASLAAAPVLLLTMDEEWQRLAAMSGVSLIAVLGTALALPVRETAGFQSFYERVRPPGWWRRAAMAAGEDPQAPVRRLAEGSVALLAAAVSIYGSLVAATQVLLGRFGPLTCLLLGAAGLAAPIWIHYVRHGCLVGTCRDFERQSV
jgi:hypothetical protein